MMKNINRFGEIDYDKNEALITMPFLRIGTESIEELEESYRQTIKRIDYTDFFLYANSLVSVRDRLQMSFDIEGTADFHHIHRVSFENMLPYLYSMVDIAEQDVNVLWEKNNFVLDLNEQKVKAFLFEFDGYALYKKDSNLEGLKELILLALTKNHAILGKPKRADFIEQTEQVFQFAEDVIRSKSVEEIRSIIQSYESDINYRIAREEAAIAEKEKNSKWLRIKNKLLKQKPKNNDSRESQLKKDLSYYSNHQASSTKENKSFLDKMTTPRGMGITIGILVVIMISSLIIDPDGLQASGDEQKVNEMENEIQEQNEVLSAYRLYLEGSDESKQKAYAKLDKLNYNELSEEDQDVLIQWYLEQSKFSKAIATDKSSAYTVGDYLIKQDNGLESLKEVLNQVGDINVLIFDIATLEGEHQTMIEHRNIKYNERRAKELAKAYALTNQIGDLETFMEEVKDEDIQSHENFRKYYDRVATKAEDKEKLNQQINEKKNQRDKLEQQINDADDDRKEELEKDKKEINNQIQQMQNEWDSIDEDIQNM